MPPPRMVAPFCFLVVLFTIFDFCQCTPHGRIVRESPKSNAIPGCPDLDILESQTELAPEALENLILCFCKATSRSQVSISCLYGSSLDHLKKATKFVKDANKTVVSISIQHMEFPEEGVPDDFLEATPELKGLEIRECAGQEPLIMGANILKGLEEKLQNLTIHSCHLEKVPEAINGLKSLETLDLSENQLNNLTKELFENKKMLKYLDISGNFINHIDEDSFTSLAKLESLLVGDHNYMNETVLTEIGKLKGLKSLDMSRADGIFTPPTEYLSKLSNLQILKLSGCSIEDIEAGAFSQMSKLEQLDLRVNLIGNVSAFAFDGLEQLKRLSLAGNYIRRVEADTWTGLKSLEELDLGWNEIYQINEGAFASLADNIEVLNLRHNPFTNIDNVRGLKKLKTINLSECEKFKELGKNSLKDMPMLETVDISRGNLTKIAGGAFSDVKNTVKKLLLNKAQMTTLSDELFAALPNLEHVDLSGNPLRCDSEMGKFKKAVDSKYKNSAKEGKEFLLNNANDTMCDRPYSLRGEALFELDNDDFKEYVEKLDTTTIPTTSTTQAEEEGSTTQFVLPELFIGAKSNESIFKEEPRREVYDITKTDNNELKKTEEESSNATLYTLGVILLISLVAVAAVAMFLKKKKKTAVAEATTAKNNNNNKKKISDDGMVEIELDRRSEKVEQK